MFCTSIFKSVPMVIKFISQSFAFARHKEIKKEKIIRTLSTEDSIKGDRLVTIILFILTIIGAIIFAK